MAFRADERYDLKIKIAHLFYIESKTQTEISKMLNLSRPTIIKLLNEARQEHIVRIQIAQPRQANAFLQKEIDLRQFLDIEDVKIASAPSDNSDILRDRIGMTAANYLLNLMKSGNRVGIGWGRTLRCLVEKIQPVPTIKDIEWIPLLGGLQTNEEFTFFANSLCDQLSRNFPQSLIHYLYAPIIASNATIARTFLDSMPIRKLLQKAQELDIAVIGIDGDPRHSALMHAVMRTDSDAFSQHDLQELNEKQVVGNICARFYNIHGEICAAHVDARVIAADTQALKKTPVVIAAAGGSNKVDAIIGGARSKLYNVLITDEYTAHALLSRLSESE